MRRFWFSIFPSFVTNLEKLIKFLIRESASFVKSFNENSLIKLIGLSMKTDLFSLLVCNNIVVDVYNMPSVNYLELSGVNTKEQLENLNKLLNNTQ